MSLVHVYLALSLMACLISLCTAEDTTLIYVGINKSWPDARRHCQRLGGELVSITSEQRKKEVICFIANNGGLGSLMTGHWIGLNDQATEGTFVWSDGSSGSYQHWYRGEPGGNGEARDCVFMHKTGLQYRWFDYPCSYHARFLCSV